MKIHGVKLGLNISTCTGILKKKQYNISNIFANNWNNEHVVRVTYSVHIQGF